MIAGHSRNPGRIWLAAGVIAVHGLLGYALLMGSTVRMPASVREGIALINIRPDPPRPPEKVAPPAKRSARRKDAPSPPNMKAKPAEVVAPPVKLEVVPPPVIAAPAPATGRDPTAGAAAIAGPGIGAGGIGDGRGGGGDGEGDGGTHSRWLSGRIKRSDYPLEALEAGESGTVVMRVVVGPKGRVTGCMIITSSGSPVLDDRTCRLVAKRYRYAPARDAAGRPVSDEWIEEQTWVIYDRGEGPDDRPDGPEGTAAEPGYQR